MRTREFISDDPNGKQVLLTISGADHGKYTIGINSFTIDHLEKKKEL